MSESEVPTEKNTERDPNLLYEKEESGCRLCLRLENNQMECRADVWLVAGEPGSSRPEAETSSAETEADPCESEIEPQVSTEPLLRAQERLPPAKLIQLLHRLNIKQTIDFEALYDFCTAVAEGTSQQSVLLAKGREAKSGEDGWFELLVKTSGDDAEFTEDKHGKVDLRTLNAFTEIETGQKIGIIHPPKNGQSGLTAHGLPIPAERGQEYPLIAGDGVVLKYAGRIAFAEKAGRALLEKQVLSVVDQWIIKDDVDFKVGNINYKGFVEVKGDVLDDFHIKATKGILVAGVVGACQLESEGSVEVGSMAGKETGAIICHGDLVAGYLNQATVLCYGKVLVKKEIRNSNVKATGSIIVEQGAIVGGSCVALEGIEAKVIGATSGIATYLTAGVYFPEADRFTYLRDNINSLDQQIRRVNGAIGPLESHKNLDATSEKRLSILTLQQGKLKHEKDKLTAELDASCEQEHTTSNPKINVGKLLMEGVVISLGETTEKIKMERNGPLSVVENSRQGGLCFPSLSPLQKMAAEIEDEMFETEAVETAAGAKSAAAETSP